jgi:twitching motility protein PilT
MTLTSLFEEATERKASDIHLSTGEVPAVRISGDLVRLDRPPLSGDSMMKLMDEFFPPDVKARLDVGLSAERTLVHGELSFTGVAFRYDSTGIAATFRIIKAGVPDLDQIAEGAIPFFEQLADNRHGLILITGPAGSGKWTTACSLVNRINATRPDRIFIVEAHPNYRFESQMGLVTRIHVGQDLDSYVTAFEVTHQADLDVIAVDDVPTSEILRALMILSETGHLVVANLHAESALDAIQRLLDGAAPTTDALRRSLARNLIAVTGQRLFRRQTEPGRVPAYEWITMSPTVREALIAGDIARVGQLQATETQCRSMGAALDALVQNGGILAEAADSVRQ